MYFKQIVIAFCFISFCISCQNFSKQTPCHWENSNELISPIDGILAFTDLEKAKLCATNCNKPLLIWFDCWGCISSRELEEWIESNNSISEKLRSQFVIVNLKVDEKKSLPLNEIRTEEFNGKRKEIKTDGDRNLWYQISKFQYSSQPHFAIIDSEGNEIFAQMNFLDFIKGDFEKKLDLGLKKYMEK